MSSIIIFVIRVSRYLHVAEMRTGKVTQQSRYFFRVNQSDVKLKMINFDGFDNCLPKFW